MVLKDKLSSVLMGDAFCGEFVAPEEFGMYCCLDGMYNQIGVVGEDFTEIPCDMSIMELAKYNTKKKIWLGSGIVSRQTKEGSCGVRVFDFVTHWIPLPDRLDNIIYMHMNNMINSSSKNFVVMLLDSCSLTAFKGIKDIKYADEMDESLEHCVDWLKKQKHSKCICYIIPKNQKMCMGVKLLYKDMESLDQNTSSLHTTVKLYKYHYYIKKQVMLMCR